MVLFVTISSGSSQQGFRVSFLGEGRCVDSGRDGDTGFFLISQHFQVHVPQAMKQSRALSIVHWHSSSMSSNVSDNKG
ncbi:hypothetical protein SynA1825c_01621 [Synechococcus sp. A18-25c]|nr:hypothetical protein SynA1560_01635 [Synechococcus sp. A15-60]QNJ19925.1 hypothetical protein SynA1825c_01621 [Synechococcus sp. A18-25c]